MSTILTSARMIFSFVILFLGAQNAQAKSLACWNAYSRLGSKPVLTAQILAGSKLQGIKVSELAYQAYSLNPSLNRIISGKEIVRSSNKYKGNREYGLNQGARLILPLQLSNKSLNSASINNNKSIQKKSNGVLILPFVNQNKKIKDYTYLPMMCQEII